jgi:hypothetical protein
MHDLAGTFVMRGLDPRTHAAVTAEQYGLLG